MWRQRRQHLSLRQHCLSIYISIYLSLSPSRASATMPKLVKPLSAFATLRAESSRSTNPNCPFGQHITQNHEVAESLSGLKHLVIRQAQQRLPDHPNGRQMGDKVAVVGGPPCGGGCGGEHSTRPDPLYFKKRAISVVNPRLRGWPSDRGRTFSMPS